MQLEPVDYQLILLAVVILTWCLCRSLPFTSPYQATTRLIFTSSFVD